MFGLLTMDKGPPLLRTAGPAFLQLLLVCNLHIVFHFLPCSSEKLQLQTSLYGNQTDMDVRSGEINAGIQ